MSWSPISKDLCCDLLCEIGGHWVGAERESVSWSVTPLLIHPASHYSTYLAYISRGKKYPHLQDTGAMYLLASA